MSGAGLVPMYHVPTRTLDRPNGNRSAVSGKKAGQGCEDGPMLFQGKRFPMPDPLTVLAVVVVVGTVVTVLISV